MIRYETVLVFFFFNDTATTEIYTLSLHDALPIWKLFVFIAAYQAGARWLLAIAAAGVAISIYYYFGWIKAAFFEDRKSTRLNSSHANISYAVFCLKKKIIAHFHIII